MLKEPSPQQHELEMVCLESLVPETHLLRLIDHAIDFEFIRERVRHLYCANNGRPALDPVVLFKMLFLGYLFGIRSERQLVREIQVNVAYRWFLRFNLTDKVPDASTLSQNRRRRFHDSHIYQEIFDEIVLQAMRYGLVGGEVLYTDSTHLKANANKNKYDLAQAEVKVVDYLESLEQAIESDRKAHGKQPLKTKLSEQPPKMKDTKVSRTDSDSGYMVREGKPKGFFYLDHRTVDGRHAIITDSYATPANLHDSRPYLDRLDRQRERFGFDVWGVGLDAGYYTAGLCKGLEDRGIYGVMGYRRPNKPKGYLPKRAFTYDPETNTYRCPEGQLLIYATTNRQGYREYKSNPVHCKDCPLLGQCTRSANHVKVLTRHVWQDCKERVDQNRLTPWGKALYKRRQETVERSFADAKQLHGHRYARLRGLSKVREQCLLAATAQNMKKIAQLLARILGLKSLAALVLQASILAWTQKRVDRKYRRGRLTQATVG
ncbi:IS1182 family transposase [Marinobacter sp. CA1]|uniref:IS1182 family transposase n=1 Tax=Marinobacter sp. CA1 TaxID=2817656 RepID=UPI001D067456|nr:IS1182 family transposase [Marinobacter sp. CA1]